MKCQRLLHMYKYADIGRGSSGAYKWGALFLNGAPTSLHFDQQKHFVRYRRPSVGIDPVVGSLCARRKWKLKHIQRFVFVPRCSTSSAFLLIFTVSSSLSREPAMVLCSHRMHLNLVYLSFFLNTGYLVCSQSELVKAAFGTINQDSPKGSWLYWKNSQPVAAECSQM